MLKLAHLMHPIRTVRFAQRQLSEYWRMREVVLNNEDRYKHDPRCDPQSVTEGFAPHPDLSDNDRPLLERICAAYSKAMDQQRLARREYGATSWWQGIRSHNLSAVQHALATGDIERLQTMYRNFFRDPCATGLVLRPPGRSASYIRGAMGNLQRRFILGEALYRMDYWRSQTQDRFPVSDLRGPDIGNPFGVMLEGTFVASGAEYQHYCAQRIADLLPSHNTMVAEIGGGFGAMAYYLLQGSRSTAYINFDVPESLALTAYYLAKSMPGRKMLLYGEDEITLSSIGRHDIILMPAWELAKIPERSVNITFSSHALSDIAPAGRMAYLKEISRFTHQWLLCIGSAHSCESLQAFIKLHYASFTCVSSRRSEWNLYREPKVRELEDLYRVEN